MSSARELAAEARAALERAKAMERDPFSGGNHPVQDEDLYSMRERTRRRHDCVSAAAERWVGGTYLRGVEPDGTLRLLSEWEKQEAIRVLEAA